LGQTLRQLASATENARVHHWTLTTGEVVSVGLLEAALEGYAPHSSIRLDAVAALHGIATVEGAQKNLFVTTLAYAPVAKRFAARTSGAMELRDIPGRGSMVRGRVSRNHRG
ncbi:restriction endonuclease, partial [Bradyrhizobium cytisi]|uniref:restriction endonuclease n=1 Tax=Bradyrhizobium cytisi TaxID=515489 RepID=UPI001AED811F